MTKRKQESELVPVPVVGQEIDTSIDMKLSKQDLIDMVVEETRDSLQAQVDQARVAFETKNMEFKTRSSMSELSKRYEKAIEARYTKELKLVTDNGKVEVSVEHEGCYHEALVLTERGFLNRDTLYFRHRQRHDDKEAWTIRGEEEINFKVNIPNAYRAASSTNPKKVNALTYVSVGVVLRLPKPEMESLFADVFQELKQLNSLYMALQDLERQLAGVDKMGKKAKTQLVKRILESSSNGRALLANVGAIKANVNQLLLEGSKK